MSFFKCCSGRKSNRKDKLCSFSYRDDGEYPPAKVAHPSNPEWLAYPVIDSSKSRRLPIKESKDDDQVWKDGLQMRHLQKHYLSFGSRENQSAIVVNQDNDTSTLPKNKHPNQDADETIEPRICENQESRTQYGTRTCPEPIRKETYASSGSPLNNEHEDQEMKEIPLFPHAVIRPSRTPCSTLDCSIMDSLRVKSTDATDMKDFEVCIMDHQHISDLNAYYYKSGKGSDMNDTTETRLTNRICDQGTERVKALESSDVYYTKHTTGMMLGKNASSIQVDTRMSKASFSSSFENHGTHVDESLNSLQVHNRCISVSVSQDSSSSGSSSLCGNEEMDMQDVDWEAKRNEITSNIKRNLSQHTTPISDYETQRTGSIEKRSQKELSTADTDLSKLNNATIEADLAYFRKKLRNDVTPMHDKHKHFNHVTPKKQNSAHWGEIPITSPETQNKERINMDTPASVSASTSYSNTPGNQTPESSSFLSNSRGVIWNGFYDDCIKKPYETDPNLHTKRSMSNYRTMDLGAISSIEGTQFNLTSAMSSESSLATEPLWNTLASVFDHNHSSRSEYDVAISRFGSRQVSLANLRNTSNYRLGSNSTAGLSLRMVSDGGLVCNLPGTEQTG